MGSTNENDTRREGPVNAIAYLLEKAIESGIAPLDALQLLWEHESAKMIEALSIGDPEGLIAPFEFLYELAAFVREARHADSVLSLPPADDPERARFVSVLHARQRSLRDFAARARRLANLAIHLQHDRSYWPGPGAIRGSERWAIAHDSLEVICKLALPLAGVAEGHREVAEDDILAKAAASMLDPAGVAELARRARNLVRGGRGGRPDNSRRTELRETRNMLSAYLLLFEHLRNEDLSGYLLSSLADKYGEAFRDPAVHTACVATLRLHRAKPAVAAIAADIVLAAYRAPRSKAAPSDYFLFPIGKGLGERASNATASARRNMGRSRRQVTERRLLMQDFAKA